MKAAMYMIFAFIAAFFGLIGVALVQAGGEDSVGIGLFLLAIGVIGVVLCIVGLNNEAKRKQRERYKTANDARLMYEGKIPYLKYQVKHLAGLNMGQYAYCMLTVWKDRVSIEDKANHIVLPMSQIRSASVTDREYSVYINKGNAGKAFLGSFIGGAAVGVAMGGPQAKEQKMHERSLCIQYVGSDGVDGVLLFETPKMYDFVAAINRNACAGAREQKL